MGGHIPIAIGVAWSIKLKKDKVYCFIGDMTSETGMAHESINLLL